MDSASTNDSNATSNAGKDPKAYTIFVQVVITLLFFFVITAFLCNAIVLAATYLDRRLHNANKYFVASLAFADLLTVMFSMTIRLDIYLNVNKPMALALCRFWVWVDIFTEAASITTVTVISFDRYYKVSRPFRYKTNMTASVARRILTLLWIYSAVLGVLGLIPYGDSKGVHSTADYQCRNDNRTFYTIAAVLVFFMPVAILIVMGAMIFRVVQTYSRNRLERHEGEGKGTRIRNSNKIHPNRRSVVTLTFIVVAFIFCWGPFFLLFIILQYRPSSLLQEMGKYDFHIMTHICFTLLPCINSFLNPIIYAFGDRTFNVAIKDMICFKAKRRKHYSDQHLSTTLTKMQKRDKPST